MKKVLFILTIFSLLLVNCGDPKSEESNNTSEVNEKEMIINAVEETVEINGVNHFIKKIGKGEPIVVLHGGPGIFHNYLVPHFQELAQNYQVVFYDQRACGKTAFPKDTSSINIEAYIEDLEVLRTHLKIDKINLLGHSWGSLLALKYGLKYPENLKNLILVSPAPSNTEYFDKTFANIQQKRSEEDTKELITTWMSKDYEDRDPKAFKKVIILGDKTNLADQSQIEKLYEPMVFTKDIANSSLIVNSLLERTYINFDITKEGLDKINCPAIILLGDLDNVPFSSAQAIQEGIPGCQLKVFKKCAHYPFFEVPKEFNGALNDFLNPDYEQ